MPQLDTVTFLSQFFWLAFFFLGFYFALVQFFLPRMARILKFRGQKMEQIKTQSAFALAEAQGHQQKRWENYGHSLALQKKLATQAAALQKEAVEETWENHLSLTTGPLLNQAYQAEKRHFEESMLLQNSAILYFSTLPADKASRALPAEALHYGVSSLLLQTN